jgi:hypothetical protein
LCFDHTPKHWLFFLFSKTTKNCTLPAFRACPGSE